MSEHPVDKLREIFEENGHAVDEKVLAEVREYCNDLISVSAWAEVQGLPLDKQRVVDYLKALINDIENGVFTVKGFEINEGAETTSYTVEVFNVPVETESETIS